MDEIKSYITTVGGRYIHAQFRTVYIVSGYPPYPTVTPLTKPRPTVLSQQLTFTKNTLPVETSTNYSWTWLKKFVIHQTN